MRLVVLIEKYGFLLILLYCLGAFSPDFSYKSSLMDLDLSERLSSKSGSNIFKQAFWLIAFGFYSVINFKRIIDRKLSKELIIVLLMIVFISFTALITVLWTENVSHALKRAVFQLIFCVCVIFSFNEALQKGTARISIYIASIIVVSLVLISIALGSGFSGDGALAGYMKGKNLLGMNIAVLILLIAIIEGKFIVNFNLFGLINCILLFILLLTISKTNIALVVGFIILSCLNASLLKKIFIFTSFSLVFVFIGIPYITELFGNYWNISDIMNPTSLTGRGVIWGNLYYDLFYFEKLSFGYGYGSYFGVDTIPYFFDERHSFLQYISSAHNGYIELFIQFGFYGAVVIIMFLIMPLKNNQSSFLWSGAVFVLLHNITESTLMRDQNLVWLLYLVILLCSNSTMYNNILHSINVKRIA